MKRHLLGFLLAAGFLFLSTRAFAVYDLRLDSVTSPSSVILGSSVTYAIAFSNAGPSTVSARLKFEGLSSYTLVSYTVTIAGVPRTCTVWGRQITCPWVSMPAEASGTATIVVSPTQVGTFNAHITLYPMTDTNSTNNQSTRTTAVTLATEDLQLTPSLVSNAPRNLGQIVYYTFMLTNAGPSSATNSRLTANFSGPFNLAYASEGCAVDPAVANTVSCNIGSLASAGRLLLRMDMIPTTVGSFAGTASLTSDLVDSNPANSSSVVIPPMTINPALPVADLALTLGTSADSVAAGTPLIYTVAVNNNGPEAAPAVSVSSSFSPQTAISTIAGRWSPNPATQPFTDIPSTDCLVFPFDDDGNIPGMLQLQTTRCSLPNLPSGGQIVVSISASRSSVGTITHNASVSSTGSTDPVAANNSVVLTTTVTPAPPPTVDLVIAMAASPDPVNLNENLVYTLTVSNSGSPANNVVVTDPLPTGLDYVSSTVALTPPVGNPTCTYDTDSRTVTCTLGMMPPTGRATIGITVRPTAAGTLTSTARVEATPPDPDTSNNSVTLNLQVINPSLCGNTTCDTDSGETCTSCPNDCGVCGNSQSGQGTTPAAPPESSGTAACGNGTCETGEDTANCPGDCPPPGDETSPPSSGKSGCTLVP